MPWCRPGPSAHPPSPRRDAASPRLLTLLQRLVIAYGPLTAALAIAAVLDPRTLMGEPVWVKPLKFSVSIGLNGAAMLWLVTRSPATPFVRGAALLSARVWWWSRR